MKISPEILAELSSVSPLLAGMDRKNPFSIPEGYFDSLTINVLKSINKESYKENLAVPQGYFNNLSNIILDNIKASEITASQELRTLSPMLYSVQNENVFEVPDGYFNNLSKNILGKVVDRSQAKVISLQQRKSVWQYAVAAVATGIIAVSSLMMFNKAGQSAEYDAAVSAHIKEASKFKNEQQVNAGIALLSDDEIIKFLEKTTTDIDNEVLS
jgi:hypothetical protein